MNETPHQERRNTMSFIDSPESTGSPESSRSRGRDALMVARSAFLWVAAIIGVACILLFLASMLFGIRPQIVVSGSMEPQIPTGALVLTSDVAAADLRVGDVVTVPVRNGGGLVTHRIVAIEPIDHGVRLTLQGDANAAPDPDTHDVAHAGRVVATIPYVGFVATMIRTPFGIAGIVLFAAAVVVAFAIDLRPRRRKH